MSKEYPPGGVLFPSRDKSNERAPDFYGSVEFDQELLDEIKSQLEANPRAKLELAGWKKMGQKGSFISLKAQPPKESRRPPEDDPFDMDGPPKQKPSDDLDDEIPF